MRILIVDDDTMFREELAGCFREKGHVAEEASSVPKAEELLEHEEFDVVFTDLKMPRHSGMELLKEIKQKWPRTLVVMITGYATVDTAIEAMKLGAFDYIRKPFKMEQLQQALDLIDQERKYEDGAGSPRDPLKEARNIAKKGDHDVIYFGAAVGKPVPNLTFEPLEPENPSGLEHRVMGFIREHPNAAVVISSSESLFEGHKLEDILAVIGRIRDALEGHGPLRVAFDPAKMSKEAALALSATIAAKETHETLEALASPIRRRAIERLVLAPASFTEIMRFAGIDETPKMSFHMRKLVEDGLVIHGEDSYKLSPRGRSASQLIHQASSMPPTDQTGNLAFPEMQ